MGEIGEEGKDDGMAIDEQQDAVEGRKEAEEEEEKDEEEAEEEERDSF